MNELELAKLPQEKLVKLLQNEVAKVTHRADLLPFLFRINGKPYSLDRYPQFRELYGPDYPKSVIFMCGRQIGKTTNLARSQVLDCLQIPYFQVLYVAPLQAQAQRYSVLTLRPAIRECKLAVMLQNRKRIAVGRSHDVELDAEVVTSVLHQSFKNGSGIQLMYAKTSPDRARGIVADRIDFDEIQDQLIDCIPVICESTRNSDWGLRRYTGTAKTVDNTIEALWQQSSQCEWTMKCEGCNHWNQPTIENDVFSMIRVEGLVCSKCGKKLDVTTGMWVASNRSLMGRFIGYHIPQCIVPAIVNDRLKWHELLAKVLTAPPTATLQENLGISADKGARLLNAEHIDRACVLPDPKELYKRRKNYVYRVMGIDWGIAEQTSFTVATVLGVRNDGQLHLLWAKRYIGADPEEVLKDISLWYRYWGVDIVAADFGMGYVNNALLQTQYQMPVVGIQLCSQNRLLTYNPLFGRSRWSVDRTSAMTLMFLGIVNGRILFPPKTFMTSFKPDLLSPYEVLIETPATGTTRRFARNPSQADDFAMSLTFASVAAMHYIDRSIMDLVPDGAYRIMAKHNENNALDAPA